MTDEKKPTKKKPIIKQCVALKKLVTFSGNVVLKGGEFTCSEKDHKHFKANKAV